MSRVSVGPVTVYGYHDYGAWKGPFYCGVEVCDCTEGGYNVEFCDPSGLPRPPWVDSGNGGQEGSA